MFDFWGDIFVIFFADFLLFNLILSLFLGLFTLLDDFVFDFWMIEWWIDLFCFFLLNRNIQCVYWWLCSLLFLNWFLLIRIVKIIFKLSVVLVMSLYVILYYFNIRYSLSNFDEFFALMYLWYIYNMLLLLPYSPFRTRLTHYFWYKCLLMYKCLSLIILNFSLH